MSTRKRPILGSKQSEAGTGSRTVQLASGPKAKKGRAGFRDRIRDAPPLMVADDSANELSLLVDADLVDEVEDPVIAIEERPHRPQHSPSPKQLSLSPARPPHALPQPSPAAFSPAILAALQVAQQAQDSDSDGLSYVDVEAEGYNAVEAPNPFARSPSPPRSKHGQNTRGAATRRTRDVSNALPSTGHGRTARASSPRKSSALSPRRQSTADGRDQPFTFYEDPAPSPRQSRALPSPRQPTSHLASRPRPSPLPTLPLATRPTTNEEITRSVAPDDLLASFLNADKAVKRKSAPKVDEDSVLETEGQGDQVEEEHVNRAADYVEEKGEEEGEEELPSVAELAQGRSRERGKSRSTSSKGKSKARDQSDSDVPPHLAPRSSQRRGPVKSQRSAPAESPADSKSESESESEVPSSPPRTKKRGAKAKASTTAKRKTGRRKKKEDVSPETVDTEALLMMLPRRKRKIVEELTDSGEEPDAELESDEDELGYRSRPSIKSKKSSRAAAKGQSEPKRTVSNPRRSVKRPKKKGAHVDSAEEGDELAVDSGEERKRKKRADDLKRVDDYELEVMTVL